MKIWLVSYHDIHGRFQQVQCLAANRGMAFVWIVEQHPVLMSRPWDVKITPYRSLSLHGSMAVPR